MNYSEFELKELLLVVLPVCISKMDGDDRVEDVIELSLLFVTMAAVRLQQLSKETNNVAGDGGRA